MSFTPSTDPSSSFAGSPADATTSLARPRANSRGKLWTGRVLSSIAVLFLLFDAVGKFVMPPPVTEACARLGFPLALVPSIGFLLLVCTAVYAIPRTAILGAILLTGFLGGAVTIQMRAGSPMFETIFPVLFGILGWAGVLLREQRLLDLFPLRSNCAR
ncbi:conserved membrane hypothetical protein [Candidatus Sulfotelmatomonas gaucii]|uniref:DoxX family protein n=1 Tax=Candidatus Sulfuritelmatomonas gaucii TaxID=2043161 RepID=A0A2N9L880_9BACT|nr:conserved membrane hypothetical protein [Candidatus Sulfotelmatomonas gaucii]